MHTIERLTWAALLAVATIAGCGPAVSPQELGQVQREVPKFVGEKQYHLPPAPLAPIGAPKPDPEAMPHP